METPNPLVWLVDLITMALNLNFIIPFFRSQFRRLSVPQNDFSGQIIIVTGANVGLGREAARHFVRLNAKKVILACRDTTKGEDARADITRSTGRDDVVEVWPLDLSSFDSVREFCRRAADLERVDVVVENAGVAVVSPSADLVEGYERTITVNVISTFLMALLLLPKLRRTALRFNTQPRLVVVSSEAHFMTTFRERTADKIFDTFKSTKNPSDRYAVSKLLQIFVIRQLAQAMNASSNSARGSVILNTLTPGFCRTSLFRDNTFPANVILQLISSIIGRSAEVGSRVLVYAAAAGPETHGKWIDSYQIREPSAFVRGQEGAKLERRVYEELMGILENVEPGVTNNI